MVVPATKKINLGNENVDSVFYEITYKEFTGWAKSRFLTEKLEKPKTIIRKIKKSNIENEIFKQKPDSSHLNTSIEQISSEKNTGTDFNINQKNQLKPGKKYFVQAGSFRNLSLATSLKERLSKLGIENISISKPVLIKKTNWYRVYISQYQDYKSAFRASQDFSNKYSITTSVAVHNEKDSFKKANKIKKIKTEKNLILDYYTLQLNSVEDLTMAKLLVDKYEVMGIKTEISSANISDLKRYRIRYGKFKRIAEAQAAAKQLKDKHGLDSWADNVYK